MPINNYLLPRQFLLQAPTQELYLVDCTHCAEGYDFALAPQPEHGFRTRIAPLSATERDTVCKGTFPIRLPKGGIQAKRIQEVFNIHVTDRTGTTYPVYRIAGFETLFLNPKVFRRGKVTVTKEEGPPPVAVGGGEEVCGDPDLP